MTDFERLREIVRAEIKPLRDEVETVREILTGNGEPAKGVIVRVDRLEQSEQRRGRILWATATVALGSAAAWIKAWIGSHGGS